MEYKYCPICGKKFESKCGAKYCSDKCRKEGYKRRNTKQVKSVPSGFTCGKKDCYYSGDITGGKCCDYILVEKQPRGCPANENCIKYKPKKGRRKHDLF